MHVCVFPISVFRRPACSTPTPWEPANTTAFKLTLRKQLSAGLTFQAAYTFSRAFTDQGYTTTIPPGQAVESGRWEQPSGTIRLKSTVPATAFGGQLQLGPAVRKSGRNPGQAAAEGHGHSGSLSTIHANSMRLAEENHRIEWFGPSQLATKSRRTRSAITSDHLKDSGLKAVTCNKVLSCLKARLRF